MIDFNEPPPNVHVLPHKPDAEAMRVMLDALFRSAAKGLIELSWTSQTAPHGLNSARMFDLTELDDLIEEAVRLNQAPNRNLYISAGLRRETVSKDRRAKDEDVIGVTAIKIDFDQSGSYQAALERMTEKDVRPNLVVITGRHPHLRAHAWFILDEPADDLDTVRYIEERFAVWLGGDPSIVNPSRVMRLGGSVAWPLKAGRSLETTEVITDGMRVPAWTLDELAACARNIKAPTPGAEKVIDFNTAKPQSDTSLSDLIGKAIDNESWHNNTLRAIAHMIARGTEPDIIVDLLSPAVVQPGYTLSETRQEVAIMVEGALRRGFAPDRPPSPEEVEILHQLWPDIEYQYEPELVEDLLPQIGLATLYGPSTVGKSFVALDWASTIATGRSLFGRDTEPVGVLYLAFEGFHGLKKRIHGIKQEKGLKAVALELVDAPWTLSDPKEWAGLRAHIEGARGRLDETGFPLGIIVVDTLTAAYAGVDANSQADVTRAMKHLKRLAMDLKCLVLVIGHTGKDTSRGMAGSFAYKSESDSFIELQAERDEEEDTILRRSVFVEKVKDGASDFTLADYTLDEVRIGTKPNGKPITTCVVRWAAPQRKKAPVPAYTGAYQTILDALQDGGLTTWEVADRLGVDRSNAGKKLRKLEQDGAIFSRDDGPRKIWVAIAHNLPSEDEQKQ